MMEIEKRLASADLSQFKTAPMEHFAREIARYRLWKTKEALSRINYAPLKTVTAEFYFNNAARYLSGGSCVLSKPFKGYLDKYKNIGPIEPETGCRRGAFSERTKRKSRPIISEELREKRSPLKNIVQSFIYAVKIGNMLMTFKTSTEAQAFTQGYKMANPIAEVSEVHINSDAIEVVK